MLRAAITAHHSVSLFPAACVRTVPAQIRHEKSRDIIVASSRVSPLESYPRRVHRHYPALGYDTDYTIQLMPPKRRAPPPPFTGVGRVTRSRSAANGISNDSTTSGAPAFVAPSVASASEEGAPVQEGGAPSRGQRPRGLAAARKARSGDSSESATSTATPGGGFSGGQRPQGLAPIHGVRSIDDYSAPKAGSKARNDSHSMKGKGTTAQQREVTRHHLEMVQERLEEEKAERATMGNERKKRKIASPKNWAAGPSSAGPSDSKWNPVGGDETDKMHTSDEENENDFSELLESSDNDDSDEDPEWEDVDLDAQGLWSFRVSYRHPFKIVELLF